MIGCLKGQIILKKPPMLIIDVNGVGYEVFASMNTIYQCPDNQAVTLYTHLVVREDAHVLYGFSDLAERSLFRHIIKTNGVGPKLALSILSSISCQDFVQCIHQQDTANLVRIPGIGKKTAERLIIDMTDRLKDWYDEDDGSTISSKQTVLPQGVGPQQDAISALVSLGYKVAEARQVVLQIAKEEMSSETIIKESLKQLAG